MSTIWAVTAAVVFSLLRPSKADLAAETRLLGRWEVWYAKYNPTVPPDRIIEWMPDGGVAHYSPELEPWGDTSENPEMTSAWRIRKGKLITELRNPSAFRGTVRESTDLIWESDDAVVFHVTSASGQKAQLHYRRLTGTPIAIRKQAEPSGEREFANPTNLLK